MSTSVHVQTDRSTAAVIYVSAREVFFHSKYGYVFITSTKYISLKGHVHEVKKLLNILFVHTHVRNDLMITRLPSIPCLDQRQQAYKTLPQVRYKQELFVLL